jgi:hypothetical protein
MYVRCPFDPRSVRFNEVNLGGPACGLDSNAAIAVDSSVVSELGDGVKIGDAIYANVRTCGPANFHSYRDISVADSRDHCNTSA